MRCKDSQLNTETQYFSNIIGGRIGLDVICGFKNRETSALVVFVLHLPVITLTIRRDIEVIVRFI
jgi:hypothetical protein